MIDVMAWRVEVGMSVQKASEAMIVTDDETCEFYDGLGCWEVMVWDQLMALDGFDVVAMFRWKERRVRYILACGKVETGKQCSRLSALNKYKHLRYFLTASRLQCIGVECSKDRRGSW